MNCVRNTLNLAATLAIVVALLAPTVHAGAHLLEAYHGEEVVGSESHVHVAAGHDAQSCQACELIASVRAVPAHEPHSAPAGEEADLVEGLQKSFHALSAVTVNPRGPPALLV